MVYDRVRDKSPQNPDVYIATAELALGKHDYQLASTSLRTAAKLQPDNPQIPYLQARAYLNGDLAEANKAMRKALSLNPRHVPTLLLQADQLLQSERYEEAAEVLSRVLEVNPFQPEAWAYHSVLARLAGHFEGADLLRDARFVRLVHEL